MKHMFNMLLIVGGFCVFHGLTSYYGVITGTSFVTSLAITASLLIINGFYFLLKGEKDLVKKQKGLQQ